MPSTTPAAEMTPFALESCNSRWLFDPAHMRFRRAPLGPRPDVPSLRGDWSGYSQLDVDASTGTFVVHLNPEGTNLLRAWAHSDPCPRCAAAEDIRERRRSIVDRGADEP